MNIKKDDETDCLDILPDKIYFGLGKLTTFQALLLGMFIGAVIGFGVYCLALLF